MPDRQEEQFEFQPLAPAIATSTCRDDDGLPPISPDRLHRKYVMCCGCVAALILILVVVFLVLMFTVIAPKCPKLTMKSLKVDGLDRLNWQDIKPDTNLTILAEISVKNPNIFSFKFNVASTNLSYDGNFMGISKTPQASMGAGRTIVLNVSVDVMLAKILNISRLQSDYVAGILPVSSDSMITGKVNIFNVIKRGVIVRTNCTMKANVTSFAILGQKCDRKINA